MRRVVVSIRLSLPHFAALAVFARKHSPNATRSAMLGSMLESLAEKLVARKLTILPSSCDEAVDVLESLGVGLNSSRSRREISKALQEEATIEATIAMEDTIMDTELAAKIKEQQNILREQENGR